MNKKTNFSTLHSKELNISIDESNWSFYTKIEMKFWKLYNKIDNYFFNLKKKYQRFKKGYSFADWQYYSGWFFDISIRMLEEMKININSHPIDLTFEEWKDIIQKIIDGFKIGKKVADEEAIFIDEYNKLSNKNKELYKNYFEYELVDKNKLNNAFKLFQKYIFYLGD